MYELYISSVLAIPARLALLALFMLLILLARVTYLQNLGHHTTSDHRRPLRKPPHELVQKLFRADLQMHRVSAVAHQIVEGVQRE